MSSHSSAPEGISMHGYRAIVDDLLQTPRVPSCCLWVAEMLSSGQSASFLDGWLSSCAVQAAAAAALAERKRREAAAWLIQRMYRRHKRRRAAYMMKGMARPVHS